MKNTESSGVNQTEPRLFQQGCKVFLKLPPEPYPRNIGEIYGGVYHKYISPRKHTHNKSESIGFNYRLIKDGSFRYVCCHIGAKEFWTYREFILAHGHFQHYKRKGYERQIFLNYNQFGIERARKWYEEKKVLDEKRRRIQQSQLGLFDGISAS